MGNKSTKKEKFTADRHECRRHKSRRMYSARQAESYFAKLQQSDSAAPRIQVHSSIFFPEFPYRTSVNEQTFQVDDVIAKGAFGNVLRVHSLVNRKVYAMKVMDKTKVLERDAVKSSKEEVNIQSAVGHHPFIVMPHHFFQNKENLFIVMDYVPKGELYAAWKHYRIFPEALVRLYIAELAIVLDYLHDFGIIYRDLKLENILIDDRGHLQVIDFGLAKWLKRRERTKTVCGTLQYIAPEVLHQVPYTHAVDWWSLGIVMYILLVGHYPVTGARNHKEMAILVDENDYSMTGMRMLTTEVQSCVAHLLNFNPDERISSLRQLQRQKFFKHLNFDCLVSREATPQSYLQSREYFDKNSREYLRNSEMVNESFASHGSWDDLLQHGRGTNRSITWIESVASLAPSYV